MKMKKLFPMAMLIKKLFCKLGLHSLKIEPTISITRDNHLDKFTISYGSLRCERCKKEIGRIVIEVKG